MPYILEVIYSAHVNEIGSSDEIIKIFKYSNTINECHELFYTYLCENKYNITYVDDIIHNRLYHDNEQEEKSNSNKLSTYADHSPCNWIDFCEMLFLGRNTGSELIFSYRIYDISSINGNDIKCVLELNEDTYKNHTIPKLTPHKCFTEEDVY